MDIIPPSDITRRLPDVYSPEFLPVPDKLAALTRWDIAPFGPLVMSADVAAAFGVSPSALRKWRSEGKFPDPVYKRSTASYYRVEDLVAPFYRRFPGLLPDEPTDPMSRFLAVAIDKNREAASSENDATSAENGGKPRYKGITLSESLRLEMVSIVTDAVSKLVEKEPENAGVVETLAAEIAAQRQELERRGAEIEALREKLSAVTKPRSWRTMFFGKT